MSNQLSQQIADFKNTDWHIEEMSGCLHTLYIPMHANAVCLLEEFPYGHELIVSVLRNGVSNYAWKMADCKKLGRNIFTELLNDENFLDSYYQRWQQYLQDLKQVFKKIKGTDLARLNDKEFLTLFNEFVEAYMREYALSLTTNSFGFFAEDRLRELLKGDFTQYFPILSSSTKESFNTRCELSLLKIASLVNEKGWADVGVTKLVEKHVADFHWIENNYATAKYLDQSYVKEAVAERQDNPEQKIKEIKEKSLDVKKQRGKILEKLEASRELRLLIESLDFFIHWQDQRKEASQEALYYQYELLNEIVRRTPYSLSEIQSTMHTEIEDISAGRLAKSVLHERHHQCAFYIRSDKQLHFHTGSEAQKIIDLMLPKPDKIDELQGTIASVGQNNKVVQGTVEVVQTAAEAKNFKDGHILVTSMTRPDMVPFMKQAKAIITNEGGITCHAAVVSRELEIPCIIGTKVATKVLKNGCNVEMNMDTGIVKIL